MIDAYMGANVPVVEVETHPALEPIQCTRTLDDIKQVGGAMIKKGLKPEWLDILKTFDVSKLSELSTDYYDSVYNMAYLKLEPTKVEPEPAKAEPAAQEPDPVDKSRLYKIRKMLAEKAGISKKWEDHIRNTLIKYGAEKLHDVSPKHWDDIIKEVEEFNG